MESQEVEFLVWRKVSCKLPNLPSLVTATWLSYDCRARKLCWGTCMFHTKTLRAQQCRPSWQDGPWGLNWIPIPSALISCSGCWHTFCAWGLQSIQSVLTVGHFNSPQFEMMAEMSICVNSPHGSTISVLTLEWDWWLGEGVVKSAFSFVKFCHLLLQWRSILYSLKDEGSSCSLPCQNWWCQCSGFCLF